MHYIQYNKKKKKEKDTRKKSIGKYKNIIVLNEIDFKNQLICLRGYRGDLILIPRDYKLSDEEKLFLHYASAPNGIIKEY